MPRAYKKKPKPAYQKEVHRPATTMKRLCSDQFGKQYAKEQYDIYSDTTLFQTFAWSKHIPRLKSMCGIAYWLETSDECPENREAAMIQAESAWVWLWKKENENA